MEASRQMRLREYFIFWNQRLFKIDNEHRIGSLFNQLRIMKLAFLIWSNGTQNPARKFLSSPADLPSTTNQCEKVSLIDLLHIETDSIGKKRNMYNLSTSFTTWRRLAKQSIFESYRQLSIAELIWESRLTRKVLAAWFNMLQEVTTKSNSILNV